MTRGLVLVSLALAGCGSGWFDVPVHAHRATVPVCAPVPADQRVLSFHGVTLVPICEDVLVDPVMTDAERQHVAHVYVRAIEHNERFYGRLLALRPLVVFCASDVCHRYFLGDTQASMTIPENSHEEGGEYVGDERRTIVITHREMIGHVVAHELSHTELAFRVGDHEVPAWFNEGLASLVGDDPRCPPEVQRDPRPLRDLTYQDDWNHYTDDPAHAEGTYCEARDEVSAWFDAHGRDGLVALLRGVRAGQSFDRLYGALLTQR